MTVLSSAVADAIFFFAAHRIDVRFVHDAVSVYEQHIGFAFWLHFAGTTVCLAFALFGVIGITCTFLKNRKTRQTIYTLDGRVRLTFRMLSSAKLISLDQKDLKILSVSVFQDNRRLPMRNYLTESSTGRLRIVPKTSFEAGKRYSVEVKYTGRIHRAAGDVVENNGVIYSTYKKAVGSEG
ncbi:Protein C24H10.1 [Aphelenchoides avenae]|nr:Protein C24H10.1 [Aphelenchus avenae]